jgi:hypothetical protein
MSQTEMLTKFSLEELLRERTNYYNLKNLLIDFWITIEPNFIKNEEIINKIKKTNFFKRTTNNTSKYSMFITTNKEFYDWIKLRIGDFENINFNQNGEYYSDGVCGDIDFKEDKKKVESLFRNSTKEIDFSIINKEKNNINYIIRSI